MESQYLSIQSSEINLEQDQGRQHPEDLEENQILEDIFSFDTEASMLQSFHQK